MLRPEEAEGEESLWARLSRQWLARVARGAGMAVGDPALAGRG